MNVYFYDETTIHDNSSVKHVKVTVYSDMERIYEQIEWFIAD